MNEARRALYCLSSALYERYSKEMGQGGILQDVTHAKLLRLLSEVTSDAADKLKAYERGETSIPKKV